LNGYGAYTVHLYRHYFLVQPNSKRLSLDPKTEGGALSNFFFLLFCLNQINLKKKPSTIHRFTIKIKSHRQALNGGLPTQPICLTQLNLKKALLPSYIPHDHKYKQKNRE
jgi:hypothetical protein